ncbi:hypothetical protein FB45DRAFT_1008226 [Roridomyces roridus]|uniref:Uncharacterized protein n=1 Tax=Roridomyces roridus TaxID=1738132 RepID=A0AAD7BB42_9AGAR|nr:hypothetical protein FB45DRAFT_1008226 [Roridomyces roridus]
MLFFTLLLNLTIVGKAFAASSAASNSRTSSQAPRASLLSTNTAHLSSSLHSSIKSTSLSTIHKSSAAAQSSGHSVSQTASRSASHSSVSGRPSSHAASSTTPTHSSVTASIHSSTLASVSRLSGSLTTITLSTHSSGSSSATTHSSPTSSASLQPRSSSAPSTSAPGGVAGPTTQVAWNPNPTLPPNAVSEAFVHAGSTKVIAIPKATTTVVVAGANITLAPGGLVVNGLLPSGVTMPGAVNPTWNPNIIPPPKASSVTFTHPPSYTKVVAVPKASNAPPLNITGPPGDKNSRGEEWWLLLFGGVIGGLLPLDIGVVDGVKPNAMPLTGWVGPWAAPAVDSGPPNDPTTTKKSTPTSTTTKPQTSTKKPTTSTVHSTPKPSSTHSSTSAKSSSSRASSSSSASCPAATAPYDFDDDPADADWDALGLDPDRRRSLTRRAGRDISLGVCQIDKKHKNRIANPTTVNLGAGNYYTIGLKAAGGSNDQLSVTAVGSIPDGNGPTISKSGKKSTRSVDQEHVFEIGYIGQFFTAVQKANIAGVDCAWILRNVYRRAGFNGNTLDFSVQLIQDIDQIANMVWVDKALNQVNPPRSAQKPSLEADGHATAKSNVVNDSSGKASAPPQSTNIANLKDFTTQASQDKLMNYEYFLRNFAALGGYLQQTAPVFLETAKRMQTRLAEVTPDTPGINLPVEFNDWLRTLLGQYNARYTSRLTNMWNFYSARMDLISSTTGKTVPNCFKVYLDGKNLQFGGQPAIAAQTFNIANMIPAAPTLPTCNVPGTQGSIRWGLNQQGVAVNSPSNNRILGAGRMDYYGLGNGTDFSKDVLAASRPQGANCQNSWEIGFVNSKTGVTPVFVDMACNGVKTNKVNAPMSFVVNDQVLSCVMVDTSSGPSSGSVAICDSTQAAATACAHSFIQTTYPTGFLLTGNIQFIPN